MASGVFAATLATAERHPWLVGGGFLALVLVMLVFGRSKTTPAPASFQFSYGPTNAQIQAGTQLAIAQQEDQTRVSLANTAAGVYSNYFDYLTTSGQNNNTTAIQEAQIAADTSKYTINADTQAAIRISGLNNQTAQAATAAQLAATMHGQDTQLQTVSLNDAAATQAAQLAASTAQAATAAQLTATLHGQNVQLQTANVNAAVAAQAAILSAQTTQQANVLNAQTAYQMASLNTAVDSQTAIFAAQTAQQANVLKYQAALAGHVYG